MEIPSPYEIDAYKERLLDDYVYSLNLVLLITTFNV